jgi:sulfur-oxidizing protein SoxY
MTNAIDKNRRKVLQGAVSASTMAMVAASGLILPKRLLAHWPKDAFTAEAVEDALLVLMGQSEGVEDEAFSFKVGSPPSYAVNGASVPVTVQTTLKNVERIAILVDKNPFPLAMSVDITPIVKLPFKTMIKIAEDANVIALVRADGQLYQTSRFVEVDIGGCA